MPPLASTRGTLRTIMRIGLFSDTYLPTLNGISYVLQIMQRQLEELGHEVYIFAPATNLRGKEPGDGPRVYRFPALEGVFFDEQLTSVFFPPAALRKIKKLNLEVIHFFTPGQIGLTGAYVAMRENIPLISQYSTDLYRYIDQYPNIAVPVGIALGIALPFIFKLTPRETVKLLNAFRPKYGTTKWQREAVVHLHVVLHDHCDAVIALSRKMQLQLNGWGSTAPTTLLPTGVDPLPEATPTAIKDFKKKYGIAKNDRVILYAGRISREKNLDLLLEAFTKHIAPNYSDVKLLFAGDFDYRKELERKANDTGYGERIIFTGSYIREKAGIIYGAADLFAFPSLTDTQGLVVNEAAGAGLPLVMCDPDVSELFIHDETGVLAPNNPADYAEALIRVLQDNKLRTYLGHNAQEKAADYSELTQMEKLEKLYQRCVENHKKVSFAGGDW